MEVVSIPSGGNVAYAETNKEISNKNNTSKVRLSAYNIDVRTQASYVCLMQERTVCSLLQKIEGSKYLVGSKVIFVILYFTGRG